MTPAAQAGDRLLERPAGGARSSGVRSALEELGHDVVEGVDQLQGQVGLDFGRDLDQVFLVVPRDEHALDAGPAGGQDLLADAADGQDPAGERDLAGHGEVGLDRCARKKLMSAAAMATPAEGPSLGTAPAGTWMCRSVLWNREVSSSSSLAWLRR